VIDLPTGDWGVNPMAKSHYLEKDRLANVIAAIQTLGVSEFAAGTLDRWAAELEASEELTPEQLSRTPVHFADRKKWQTVFEQHPEFFKTYTLRGEQRVSLRWRYAQVADGGLKPKPPADPAVAGEAQAEDEDFDLTKVPTKPLTPEQIQVLINTAIELHGRETSAERTPDRYRTPLMTVAGALFGSVVGGVLVALLVANPTIIRIFD